MAHRVRRFAGRTERRKTSWFNYAPTVTTVTGGGAGLVFTLNAAALALRPFTVVRTHLYWALQSDQLVATEDQIAAVGMAVVSDQAAAIGITAVPTPITDLGSDLWFLHAMGNASYEFQSAIGTNPNFAAFHQNIDSKAMRKVDIGQDLAVVVEAPAISDGVSILLMGRQLVKLH